jgi:citrate synthase
MLMSIEKESTQMSTPVTTNEVNSGLDGVKAAATRLSDVDGVNGILTIAGFLLEDLAPYATFEEVVFLLWNDRLPNADELETIQGELKKRRSIPQETINLLKGAAAKKLPPMDALRVGAGTMSLALEDPNDNDEAALLMVAALPTIVATYWRLLNGQEPVAPRSDLNHTANYLYMLDGEVPNAERVRALETYLITVSDHSLNASTFVARAIISTQSDMVSAITGAIGSLKGPLHGGAPGPALDMVFEIGTKDNAEPYIRQMLERGDRLMGFGHRVYKVRDPRADVLNIAAKRFFGTGEKADLYDLALYVEQVCLRLLEEHKPGRNLQTNVEFYTALVLHGVGMETDIFTPTFAIGRVGGWVAHALEHIREGRLVRPSSIYVGDRGRKYVELQDR